MYSREQREGRELAAAVKDNESLRCYCGSFLARLVTGGFWLTASWTSR
jgi:hypothetical protein